MFNNTYELPITKEYISHWGMIEGVREIIQNAIDSDSPFEWEFDGETLKIHSRFAKLEPKTLLLGSSTKADSTDKIGAFGEGYKLAMLVLHRAGYRVKIINNGLVWSPEFRFNNRFQTEILYVIETREKTKNAGGLTFEISGLTHDEMAEIRLSCLFMQTTIGEVKQTSKGQILMEQQGRLYVGGLYICETGLKYGYDIKPEFISLERDRRTVDNWDLKEVTRDMWFELSDYEFLAELIEKETPDVEYARFGAPEMVKEACFKHFREKHPGAVMAKDQDELEKLVKAGLTVVVGGWSYHSVVTSSKSYRSEKTVSVVMRTPFEILSDYFNSHRGEMRRPAIIAMKEILETSKNWKLK